MISWAVTFLVVALIAAVLGFTGIAGTAVNLAWIFAVIGVILAIVFAVIVIDFLSINNLPATNVTS